MVCVETIAFLCRSSVNRTDGTRYPSDLPTPVPASTIRCCSSSSACATRAAISCCCGRNSKFFALESGPFSEQKPRTRSTNSLPKLSFSEIICSKCPQSCRSAPNSGNGIVIRQSQIEIRNSNETSRSIRHSKLRAGLFLLHRRIHLDLAHLRRQRQYLEFHRQSYSSLAGRSLLRDPDPASIH